VFIVIYFIIDSVQKLLDTSLHTKCPWLQQFHLNPDLHFSWDWYFQSS